MDVRLYPARLRRLTAALTPAVPIAGGARSQRHPREERSLQAARPGVGHPRSGSGHGPASDQFVGYGV
jgi:hypothetical protein